MREALLMGKEPRGKLKQHEAELAGVFERPEYGAELVPHRVRELVRKILVVDSLLRDRQGFSYVLRQYLGLRLVGCEKAKCLYVEDEAFGRAFSPLLRGLLSRDSVVAAIDLNQ